MASVRTRELYCFKMPEHSFVVNRLNDFYVYYFYFLFFIRYYYFVHCLRPVKLFFLLRCFCGSGGSFKFYVFTTLSIFILMPD
jgi:hypothetical protein